MRFLANENIPIGLVNLLREQGHDVLWVGDFAPGCRDETVLARAVQESRVLVTYDKDFGQLAFQLRLPAECGIVLIRLRPRSPQEDNARALEAIRSMDDFSGVFAIIEEDRVRIRRL